MTLILILLGALLVRAAAVWFYERSWNRDLEVWVRFQGQSLREGEEGRLTEVIENKKRLPLPFLSMGFGVSRNLEFSAEENASVSDKAYKRDVFSVSGRQRILREVPFLAGKRGYYEIDKLELTAKSLLLSGELYDTRSVRAYLYVYPKRICGPKYEPLLQKIMGTFLSRRRLLEDPFAFRGIREYAPGDPLNWINWKASAKAGSLLVNQNDSALTGGVWLLLDVEDETIWKYQELHEECIRLAGALAEEFLAKGIETGLLSNGRDALSEKELLLPKGGGRGQREKILQSLARLDLEKPAEKFSFCLSRERKRLTSQGDFCVLLTRNQEAPLRREMEEIAKKNQGGLYLAALSLDMEFRLKSGGPLQVLRWEVEP